MLHSSRIVLVSARHPLPAPVAGAPAALPYSVVVARGRTGDSVTEHPAATMREAEALVRALSPGARSRPDHRRSPT